MYIRKDKQLPSLKCLYHLAYLVILNHITVSSKTRKISISIFAGALLNVNSEALLIFLVFYQPKEMLIG